VASPLDGSGLMRLEPEPKRLEVVGFTSCCELPPSQLRPAAVTIAQTGLSRAWDRHHGDIAMAWLMAKGARFTLGIPDV